MVEGLIEGLRRDGRREASIAIQPWVAVGQTLFLP